MKKLGLNPTLQLLVIVLIGIGIYETGLLLHKTPQVSKDAGPKLEQYADEVLKKCADKSYKPTCYEKEIPNLMDSISMEDAFNVTKIVQDKDPSYTYCHVLAHNLSAKEVDKNPNGWKDAVIRCPSGMCSNGCIHGGFQERFRAETFTPEQVQQVLPDLVGLCEPRGGWKPTGLEQASCYHALGHLTMYITNADINQSIDLCGKIALKKDGHDYIRMCYDGSFMQIFQPLEPEDFALVAGKEVKKDQLLSFCKKFPSIERSSCWTEGWPLYRPELQQPQGLVAYCLQAEASERNRCYDVLIYVITAQFNLDEQKITPYCSGLPEERRGVCFANAASRMIETDYRNAGKSVSLCTTAAPYDKNEACFHELLKFSRYNFHEDSAEFFKLCNDMPAVWKDKCLNKES